MTFDEVFATAATSKRTARTSGSRPRRSTRSARVQYARSAPASRRVAAEHRFKHDHALTLASRCAQRTEKPRSSIILHRDGLSTSLASSNSVLPAWHVADHRRSEKYRVPSEPPVVLCCEMYRPYRYRRIFRNRVSAIPKPTFYR